MEASFDEDYVRRLAAGDAEVEQHFHDYFGRLLYIKLRRKLGPREEVNDLRQDTFLRVLDKIRKGGGIRQAASLGAFVNGVCENVFREWLRKRDPRTGPDDPGKEAANDREDAESELVRDELVRQVRDVVDRLPSRDRKLLRAVFLEEGDRDEICKRFGIDREYLRVLLHRAKKRFRDIYRATGPDRFSNALDAVDEWRSTSAADPERLRRRRR